MLFPAVNWHEGLFLQPQHFQAWDRHWNERISTGEQWQNPHSYGIAEIEINSAALASGHFQLDSLKAKTPGGTLLELASGQQSERCDCRPALERAATSSAAVSDHGQASTFIDVFIGVPRLQLGGGNVDSQGKTNGARFRSELMDLPDETDASSVQPVELRRINARILLSGDDLAGYDCLAIARIVRSPDGASLELDNQYIPPLLDHAAWPQLKSHILSPISDILTRVSEQAGQAVVDAGGSLQANSALELQRLMVLQAVNPAVATARLLSLSRGFHPLTTYFELCRIAGSLDVFNPQRSARIIRPYDHDRLGPLFFDIKQRIVASLSHIDSRPYSQKYLLGTPFGLQTTLEPVSSTADRKWYIGINKGKLPIELLHQLLSPGFLDWKLGSAEQVEWLFTHRAPGVALEPVTEVPPVLPRGIEWAYFRINPTGPAWKDVTDSGTLAMRIKDTLIANRNELPGNKQLVVQAGNQKIALQIALFTIG